LETTAKESGSYRRRPRRVSFFAGVYFVGMIRKEC
jgi:hypothetical protein